MSEEQKEQTFGEMYGAVAFDGITRQRSKCKILIHSHVTDKYRSGIYELEDDVIQCSTSKTIKGGGGANFILVPRKNYLNMIYPDDYVNIYFDPGDGRGFIRTFFGFVDRVSRSINTDATGQTITRFQVVCSDFTKAFDRTNIYFNPQISAREDLIGDFAGTANLGGVHMRSKGLTMHGSPADIVMSLLHITHGFGSQFMMPDTYKNSINNAFIAGNRKKRLKWAQERLPDAIEKALKGKTVTSIRDEINLQMEEVNVRLKEREVTGKEAQKVAADVKIKLLERRGLPANFFNLPAVKAVSTVESASLPDAKAHLLDAIDFRHVEWKTIDGYVSSASITQQEGTIWSIANAYCNDLVNELFCDLRPMQAESTPGGAASGGKQDKEIHEGPYSKELDELRINTEGAARYAPCVVMREYPFSTVAGVDPPSSVKVLNKELGLIFFGGIWAKGANKPGRKVLQMPAIHEVLVSKSKGKDLAFRSLDVAVISVQDIIAEDIGRADHDHVNLIEVYSDITSGTIKHSQLVMRDVQPITCGINIARHGIRVRRHTSRFCRFGAFKAVKPGKENEMPGRKNLVRWAMLLDHWYQHNLEYLSGSFTTRAFPEIRVGYRLDIKERKESYYLEGVSHQWTFPHAMQTTLTVSRGQRNDPYPVYVLPQHKGFEGLRTEGSRLGDTFIQEDPSAVIRSIVVKGKIDPLVSTHANFTDIPSASSGEWAAHKKGYMMANSIPLAIKQQPYVIEIEPETDDRVQLAEGPELSGDEGGGAELV